jgi:hypothetical protein
VVNAFGIILGIVLVAWSIVFLDWWGYRKERQSRDRAA